ncbi:hypothetical protein EN751_05845, partial [Mesorhizobium sp. M4A.F.Ca.ET.029.04.2.1]
METDAGDGLQAFLLYACFPKPPRTFGRPASGAISVGQAGGKALSASAMHAGSPEKKRPDRQASIDSALRT